MIDLHPGEDCHIVGRGPSLLGLTADDLGPGPVITLNNAIEFVRTLGLPNPIYTMQKDGCRPHKSWEREPEAGCCDGVCGVGMWLVQPIEPEVLLVSRRESAHCFGTYPLRQVFDPEALGVPWNTPSSPCAVLLAHRMGCVRVVMWAHDSYTRHDPRTVEGTEFIDHGEPGYYQSAVLAQSLAEANGMAIEWRG